LVAACWLNLGIKRSDHSILVNPQPGMPCIGDVLESSTAYSVLGKQADVWHLL
jgi:hypothetical protein